MTKTRIDIGKRRFRRRPTTAPHERVYAIGDIHGRLDLFTRLIRRIEADSAAARAPKRRGRVIILGDFIDRGPDSRRLVHLLMAAQQRSSRLIVLLGNHEAAMLDSIAGDAQAQAGWLGFGGEATLESFGVDPPREGEDRYAFADRLAQGLTAPVVEWLRERPLSFRSGDYFFCHAGVRPGVPLARQARDDLLWVRDSFMTSGRHHGAVVVHGHSIVDAVEVRPNRISLDTAAYRTGVLSAVCLDGADGWIIATDPDDAAILELTEPLPAE